MHVDLRVKQMATVIALLAPLALVAQQMGELVE